MGAPQKTSRKAYRALRAQTAKGVKAFELEVLRARGAADVARFRARQSIDNMVIELLPKAQELAEQGRPRLLALLHKIAGKDPLRK